MKNKKKPGLILMLFILLQAIQWAGAENLLINPGMEEGDDFNATGWIAESYNNNPMPVKREAEGAYAGDWCISLESPGDSDSRLSQVVQVQPDTLYKISGWIKTENVGGKNRGANITIADTFYATQDFRGTNAAWQYAELYIITTSAATSIKLCLAIGGYSNINSGKAWFDEIVMETATAAPEKTVVYTIGPAGKTGTDGKSGAGPKKQVDFTQGMQFLVKSWGAPTLLFATTVTVAIVLVILLLIIFIGKKTQKPLFLKAHLFDKLPPLLPEKVTFRTLLASPYVKFFFICCIALFFLVDIVNSFREDFLWGSDNHYLYQAEAFLRGKVEVRDYMHDMAVHNGKNYVIYPPFPLVFVLPLVLLFGIKVKLIFVCTAIAIASVIFFYRLLLKLEIKKSIIPWVMGAFVFGTAFWFCYDESTGVAFFAHLCAAFATILCLNECLGKGRGLLAGLFLGMAFLSRQLAVFLVFFVIIALWQRKKEEPFKKKIMNLVLMCAGLGVCLIIYFAYNYARFGSIFDTGYSYLLLGGFMQERVSRYGIFHPAYIPFNFTYLFLQGFHFEFDGLKIADMDWFGTSLTFASPFVLFACRARWKTSLKLSAWISIGVIILGHLLYYNNGWMQINTQRFTLDFIPLLMILVALGMNEIPARFWKPVILFSMLMNGIALWIRLPEEAKRFFI